MSAAAAASDTLKRAGEGMVFSIYDFRKRFCAEEEARRHSGVHSKGGAAGAPSPHNLSRTRLQRP